MSLIAVETIKRHCESMFVNKIDSMENRCRFYVCTSVHTVCGGRFSTNKASTCCQCTAVTKIDSVCLQWRLIISIVVHFAFDLDSFLFVWFLSFCSPSFVLISVSSSLASLWKYVYQSHFCAAIVRDHSTMYAWYFDCIRIISSASNCVCVCVCAVHTFPISDH